MILQALLLPLVLSSAAPRAPEPPAKRFALVVASNAAPGPTRPALRFSDDDAARLSELLAEYDVDVEVVVELDAETQAVHGALVGRAHPPTKDGLERAFGRLRERILAREREAPGTTDLVIYYSGHGDVGAISFRASSVGRLRRSTMWSWTPARARHWCSVADRAGNPIARRGPSVWRSSAISRGRGWRPSRTPG
jgi:hypothetical protein